VAETLAKDGLEIEVHGKKWIENERMGLFLAVAQGAKWEPRFLIARWNGDPDHSEKTVLVGKGITFDTGGLNLKGTDFLKAMKGDMAGAAAVLGVMQAMRDLKLPLNIEAAVPLCENSIGERAYKPEDVFVSRSGISVEIANTDAEGRLILADALDYVREKLAPSRIIDVATLTGAAEVALGSDIAAVFSNTDALVYQLTQAAAHAGEHVWQMPLHAPYLKMLESDVADCKNVGTRSGGAITAALFLQKFVNDIPWVHFDIAGSAFLKESRKYLGKGATGIPVRTLVEFFESTSMKVVVEE
jgi:leucyl aminopeptidase